MDLYSNIGLWCLQELNQMDVEEIIKHRMLKFRKIGSGGVQEGIPIDPERKINMKKKETPDTQRLNLEGDVEKVKEQILRAKESSSELPLPPLNETIEKLRKEVDAEMNMALIAMGLEDRFLELSEELLKRSPESRFEDPVILDKIQKLDEEFNRGLPSIPNYQNLKYNLDKLKELTKAKNLAGKKQKAASLKGEIKRKVNEVMDQRDIKEKYEALKTEVQNSGVSKFGDLDPILKEKILKMKEEINSELANVLQSFDLNIEDIKSGTRYQSEQPASSEFGAKIQEINKETNHAIESIISSSDLKDKIEQLKLELAKAEKTPGSASENRIAALEGEIKQTIAASLESSNLKEKYDKLTAEISKSTESSRGSNGSLKTENAENAELLKQDAR